MWVTTFKTRPYLCGIVLPRKCWQIQGSLFIRLCNHIMGDEFEDGDPQTPRSVLEYQDHHENKDASKWDQEASEQDQEASKRDQNEMENNNKKFSSWDQNDENACVTNTHHDKHTRKKEKQMTYREALLGLDNSELGSDF